MSRRKASLFKSALSAIHYSGMARLAAPVTAGRGVIFMLHHVRPGPRPEFDPNGILSVTPGYLESVIKEILGAGYEPISLDDLAGRLEASSGGRPFACFTFDDGYRDNREFALPVLEKYSVPCTIYVPSAFADGDGELWWLSLEEIVRRRESITVTMKGAPRDFDLSTADKKWQAFDAIYWWLRGLPEADARSEVRRLGNEIGFSSTQFCRELVMGWAELRTLADNPLVTIGAHTRGHFAVAKLAEAEARAEIAGSVARIESELGRPCRHFSFPYGDETSAGARDFALCRELGLKTAVTTRKGLIHAHHRDRMMALPRLSLNGDYQDERYLKALLSGVPFALNDALQRIIGREAA